MPPELFWSGGERIMDLLSVDFQTQFHIFGHLFFFRSSGRMKIFADRLTQITILEQTPLVFFSQSFGELFESSSKRGWVTTMDPLRVDFFAWFRFCSFVLFQNENIHR